MRLTVVVATFNRARLVAQLLEALDAQVVPDGMAWDVVVVDNNSTDATRSTVEASRDTMRVPVTYLFEPRQGKSFALNTGIEHAKGDIIAFTDDDVIPAADWIATVVRSMREWQADIIGGRILPKWGGTVPPWLKKNGEFHARLALLEHVTAKRLTSPHGVPGVWGANMAVARDLFDRIGTFDIRLGPMGTKLYRGGEELDLVRRALSEGRTVVYDPRLVVWHQIGPDRLRRSYFRRYYFQRAEGEALVKDRRSRFTVFGAGDGVSLPARRVRARAGAVRRRGTPLGPLARVFQARFPRSVDSERSVSQELHYRDRLTHDPKPKVLIMSQTTASAKSPNSAFNPVFTNTHDTLTPPLPPEGEGTPLNPSPPAGERVRVRGLPPDCGRFHEQSRLGVPAACSTRACRDRALRGKRAQLLSTRNSREARVSSKGKPPGAESSLKTARKNCASETGNLFRAGKDRKKLEKRFGLLGNSLPILIAESVDSSYIVALPTWYTPC